MKNVIRIVAAIQIILAVAFAYYAGKIDPGVEKTCHNLADVCGQMEDILIAHKTTYRESANNILRFKEQLQTYSETNQNLSNVLDKYGKLLKDPKAKWVGKLLMPKDLEIALGKHLVNAADILENISKSLTSQASLLADYEQNTKPMTEAGFDKATSAFKETKGRLKNIKQKTNSSVTSLAYLAGVVFLLNGIAFLLIAQALPAAAPKSADC